MKWIPILALVAVLILSGCASGSGPAPTPNVPTENPGGDGSTSPKVVEVSLQNVAFSPMVITVNQGDTIRFTNQDGFAHDIFIHAGGNEFFTDPQTEANEIVEVTMTEKGTFTLDCVRHAPGMTGTIIVK